MFKKSLALLLSVLMAFSFAMVASANASDYIDAPVAVQAQEEYTPAPVTEDVLVQAEIAPISDAESRSIIPEFRAGEGDGWGCWLSAILVWPLELFLNLFAIPFNWFGVGLGNLAFWLDEIGVIDVLGTITTVVAGFALLLSFIIPLWGWLSSFFGSGE